MLRRRPEVGATNLKEIGRGGQSTVYSAVDPECGQVAVKVFHLASEDAVRLFERERDVLAKLKDVQSIVQVLRTGETDIGEPYIVMQYLAGGSLQDLVDENGPMPWTQAIRYLSTVARAVGEAHRLGIIHADLKPSNILLDAAGTPYVSDFGISKIVDHNRTVSTRLMLTPNYAAPEIFDDAEGSAFTDIYALGATVASLVAGQPPFESTGKTNTVFGVIRRVMEDPPPTLTEYGAPVRLTNVVRRAMAKDAAQRFSTAEELGDELDACLQGDQGDYPVVENRVLVRRGPEAPPDERGRQAWRNPKIVVAVLAVLALVITLGVWLLSRREDSRPRTVTVESDGSGDYASVSGALEDIPPGSSITLGAGFYEIDETLVIDKPVSIIGAGQGETRLIGQGDASIIEGRDVSLVLEDLTVGYSGSGSGVDVVTVTDVKARIVSVSVEGGTRHGLVVDGQSTGVIEDSVFSDNDGSGIVQRGASDIEVTRTTATDNLDSGFVWEASATGRARLNISERNANEGFLVGGTGGPELSNNTASDNRQSGFTWADSSSGTARNNTSTLNSGYGFVALDSSTPTLVDNSSSENAKSGFAWRHSSGGQGIDNQSTNNAFHGYVVSDTASPELTGSSATDNGESGFMWFSSGGGRLIENVAQGNTIDGFTFDGLSLVGKVRGNTALGNGRNGYFWTGVTTGSVSANVARGNAESGFAIGSIGESVPSGNIAEQNKGYGFSGPRLVDVQAAQNAASQNELGDWFDTEQLVVLPAAGGG